MNKKIYILSALAALSLGSCVDLNYTEATTKDEEWIYDSPMQGIKAMVFDVYALLPYGLTTGAMLASASDEAEYSNSTSGIQYYYNGGWSPANSFNSVWFKNWRALAEIHTYLEKMDKIDLEDYKYSSNYETIRQQFEVFPYELRFLRAYFYFELARTYGDVPLVTTTLTNAQANSVKRTPVQQIFEFIVSECDAVAQYLPVDYINMPGQEIGRAKRAAAMALKARTLLYAASPLFNTANDKELWKRAAKASKELIDNAAAWGITLSEYKALMGHDAFYNPEIIFGIGHDSSNSFEQANYPVGVENGNSGNCPSQTLVDAYEYTDNGESFAVRNPGTVTVSPTANPYEGLDPRFAATIVKNGDTWPLNSRQALTMQTYTGGFNGLPKYNGTPTGYYLRKFVNGNSVTTYNQPTGYRHTWIVFRLSEVYLNYAEAMYNYYGSAEAAGDLGMTANQAINVLRNRADIKMPEFAGEIGFDERYRRERMVELAFEEHRFWDVRRWKLGAALFKSVGTATLTRNGDAVTLTRTSSSRKWDDKYYLHPIPHTELQKNPNLKQNPGW